MIKKNFAIPILMYHHVNPVGNFINARPELFEKHLRVLKASGYETIDCRELAGFFRGDGTLPGRPVMITFDDGWLDNWVYAFPLLEKYGMKAVIFVVTSRVAGAGSRPRADQGWSAPLPAHRECQGLMDAGRGDEVMLSWDELKAMEASGLVDVQSHTHTHQKWDEIISEPQRRRETVREELEASRAMIEERLDKRCNAVCWPWGRYDEAYIEEAENAGYELMFTTEKGTNTADTDRHRLRRIVIGNVGAFEFRKKMFIHSRRWLSRLYLKIF